MDLEDRLGKLEFLGLPTPGYFRERSIVNFETLFSRLTSRRFSNTLLSLGMILLLGSAASARQEKEEREWISLFNGKDLEGWTIKFAGQDVGENYKDTFRVEDGLLKVSYENYENFDEKFGHIFFKDKFSHYRLRAEYRFVGDQCPGAPGWAYRNNGIMFHSQAPESMGKNQNFPVSIEAQMLGGDGQNDRPNGSVCTPGTHIVINGELVTNHCTTSKSETNHGDDWVTIEIEVRGNGPVKHIVNGQTVLEYEKPQLDENDADARKLILDGDKMLHEGLIALQAESHPTEFRKIEILVLEP